ncbi:MAG TPA: bifunctional lysylphosphatidylglycerol flippase/synthetase MprF [Pseudomonadales bacterium]|nr:bifunctional lysylphosphatidylglycerol flippase/synthetase MprF [Pseudomonadales bacterium]HMW15755.1 bifunctional lysylphosphatidylglycerol flippase/synthetase MprF [Pseudomonadales bacterium]HMW82351.1 bifunctional lysylphosphatidylglycerol flippase/synthetase MprF [Pseudomonadales bacterium]HMY95978.1 bifunctional lysylphosphatidylglycerol flippase/synthetase MprF [Pseudomonadales bacterium]HMZ91040.1 bifunctional lysylphosphatidylglycerol flippase/synthetase MprF [Pseudomonadales bacteri
MNRKEITTSDNAVGQIDPPRRRPPLVPPLLSRLKPHLFSLISLGLFIAALWAIHHMLAGITSAHLLEEIGSLNRQQIGLALFFALASFVALMGYDWSALNYIGQRLPASTVAFASFCGYAFSNTLGLSLLSGGSVRYRIYVVKGLDAADVGRVTLFNMLAFGIGIHIVGAAALTVRPELLVTLSGVSAPWLRAMGAAVLIAVALLLSWAHGRTAPVRLARWSFRLPKTRLTLFQLAVSVVDVLCCGACLYVLIPSSDLHFVEFMVVYALAVMAGITSHVPGGLGVFEGIMLLALSGKVSAEGLGAGLLMYRIIYHLGPLLLAMLLLALKELRDRASPTWSAVLDHLQSLGGRSVPYLASVMVFASGLVLLLSSATPATPERLALIRVFVALPLVEISHLLSSVVGLGLLIVAHGLYRKLNGAYLLALLLCLSGALFSLIKGIDYEEGLVLFATALTLLLCRHEFYRHTTLLDSPFTTTSLMAILGAVGAMVWMIFFSYQHVEYANHLWWKFAYGADASRSLRSAFGVTVTLFALGLYWLLRPPRQPAQHPSAEALEQAEAIIQQQDNTTAQLALMGDKRLLFTETCDAFLMYGIRGASWIALGDPVGSMDTAEELAWRLREMADSAGGRIAFYQARPALLPIYLDMGLTPMKLGEEGVVLLDRFSLEGSSNKHLRYACNRGERDGLVMEVIDKAQVPQMLPDLEEISTAWLTSRNTEEKGFSLGAFIPDYICRNGVAIVRQQGRPIAFATLMTTATHAEASLDLMRHRPDAPSLTMEFLFIRLMQHFKQQGFCRFNLGMAPLSGLEAHPLAPLWYRFGDLIYNRGARFYNFQGLRQFKEKFDPIWEPRYLVSEGGLSALLAITDTAALIAGSYKGIVMK